MKVPWEITADYIRSGHRSSKEFQKGSLRAPTGHRLELAPFAKGTETLIFSTIAFKCDFEQIFMSSGFMSYGKPSWVYEREASLREMHRQSEVSRLQHRIKQLEEENSDLKKKVAEMENVVMVAMGLLLEKPQSAPSET